MNDIDDRATTMLGCERFDMAALSFGAIRRKRIALGTAARAWIAVLLLVLPAAGWGPAVRAQDAGSLIVGGIELRLGMPQEEALRKLSVVYSLQAVTNARGVWLVLAKDSASQVLGSMTFTGDRLTYASKSWGPSTRNQTADAVSATLYEAVRAVTENGRRPCMVSTQAGESGFIQTTIECSGRRVIVASSSARGFGVSIDEIIGSSR